MLARSFWIESSSKLLVTRTDIKGRSSSILGRIRPLILELLALEWRKFHTFELEYLWSQLISLDEILCVASLGWGKGCKWFLGILDQNSGFHCNRKSPLTYTGGKWCLHIFLVVFDLILFQLGFRWAIVALWAICCYWWLFDCDTNTRIRKFISIKHLYNVYSPEQYIQWKQKLYNFQKRNRRYS